MIDQKLEMQQQAFNEVKSVTERDRKKYKTAVENFGMQVYANGLITTLAVIKADNDKKLLYKHITRWLQKRFPQIFHNVEDLFPVLLSHSINSYTLMLLTNEALFFADELKAFVKAEF